MNRFFTVTNEEGRNIAVIEHKENETFDSLLMQAISEEYNAEDVAMDKGFKIEEYNGKPITIPATVYDDSGDFKEDFEIMETAVYKSPELDPHETAFTASVICQNLFDAIQTGLNIGIMETHETIANIAEEFEKKYSHVEEWEEFLEKENKKQHINFQYSDWEEFVCSFATDQYLNLKI